MTLRRILPFYNKSTELVNVFPFSPSIVLSPQKLVNQYIGPCWTVRKLSTNTLHDIGFDGTGWISESELGSIIGSGQARLFAYRDQMESNDFTAPATTNEPLIWDNGFRLGHNGLPGVDFEGTAARILRATTPFNFLDSGGFVNITAVSSGLAVIEQLLSSSLVNIQLRFDGTTRRLSFASNFKVLDIDSIIFSLRIFLNGDFYVYENEERNPVTSTGLINGTFNQLGARGGGSEPFRDIIHEMIYFTGDTLPELDIINNRLNIYTP